MKILRAQFRTAPSRLLVGVAAAALLASGCSSSVSGEASPEPDGPSAQSAPSQSPSRSPSRSSGSCQMRVSSNGSIVSSGAGGRTITTNGRTSFSCGRGPLITIESIDASGVSFSADGDVVTVAQGASETVGAYRISVSEVDEGSAEFQVEPA